MIAPVGIDAPHVVHRLRREPRLLRSDDELAKERDDQPARISGRSTLTEVLVVFDPLRLIVGALLHRRLRRRCEFWRDAARARREKVSAAGCRPQPGPVGQLSEAGHLASAPRRRHLQRGVQLRCRTIFGAHCEHPPEFVGCLRGTISLPGRDRGGCKNEQSGKGERGAACHCHKSLRIISYGRIRGPSQGRPEGRPLRIVSVEASSA